MTLTGAGGAGKTRLALQVAAGVVEDYPDGVWIAELAPLTDPALVPQAVAMSCRVLETAGRPILESLVEALRLRRVLLVLDNCEHLLEACVRLADRLLRGCPHVRILATSRAPVGMDGETVRHVPSLSLPRQGETEDPARLIARESVRLFVERARSVREDFAVTEANAPVSVQTHPVEPADAALRLCVALWWFWYMRGHLGEGRRWLEVALVRDVPGQAPSLRARALAAAGILAH